MFNITENDVKQYVFNRLNDEIEINEEKFSSVWDTYRQLDSFKISENLYEVFPYLDYKTGELIQKIARYTTEFFITKAFVANKIDLNDPNVKQDLIEGNIGTPGRIAKMWTGANISDDSELMCGRWTKMPRIATFPNEDKEKPIPITKKVTINAVCSHHTAIFSTEWNSESYAIISYIPDEYVLGISKLQRLTDWVARRGWLQEELTKELYKKVSEAARTENVYVKLVNLVHSCELNRGSKTHSAGFTTEYFGGVFNNPEYRKIVNKDY